VRCAMCEAPHSVSERLLVHLRHRGRASVARLRIWPQLEGDWCSWVPAGNADAPPAVPLAGAKDADAPLAALLDLMALPMCWMMSLTLAPCSLTPPMQMMRMTPMRRWSVCLSPMSRSRRQAMSRRWRPPADALPPAALVVEVAGTEVIVADVTNDTVVGAAANAAPPPAALVVEGAVVVGRLYEGGLPP